MIPGRGGNDPGDELFGRLSTHEITGAPHLEGVGPLQIFTLEIDRKTDEIRKIVGMHPFRATETPLQQNGGFPYHFQRNHGILLAVLASLPRHSPVPAFRNEPKKRIGPEEDSFCMQNDGFSATLFASMHTGNCGDVS
jgi:hypothetical protein